MKIKNIKIGLLALMTIFCLQLQAQEDTHFIYIQSENKKPFYAIINQKLYASSSIGYLIIPKLINGKHTLSVGFPKNEMPEQQFVVNISGSDMGFLLKIQNAKDYVLVDLQTQAVLVAGEQSLTNLPANSKTEKMAKSVDAAPSAKIAPVNLPAEKKEISRKEKFVKEQNANKPLISKENPPSFNDLAILVAKDSSIVYAPVEKKEHVVVNTPPIVPDKDEIIDAIPVVTTSSDLAQPPVYINKPSPTYGIIKIKEEIQQEGKQMIFVLLNQNTMDTVAVLVPHDEQSTTTSKETIESATKVENPFFNPTIQDTSTISPIEVPCYGEISLLDFNKIRIKVLTKSADADKEVAIFESLGTQCLTVERVKTLAKFIETEESKLAFFKKIANNVADKENYIKLSDELSTQALRNEFIAYVKKVNSN